MAEPLLTAVFGANATQTSTDLVIKKSDLTSVGLTADANNSAESLLVAINLKAQTALTESARDTNILEERKTEIKEMQQFLHKYQDFKIRE
jgi:hypothetical protein